MKEYRVTLHMDNGDMLYLDNIFACNDVELLNVLLMSNNNTPTSNKFARANSGDHQVCYCVGKVSSIHFTEV